MAHSFRAACASILAVLALSTPAAAESCDLFGKIKSLNSKKPVTVTFVNRTDAMRIVMWLDFGGNPKEYAQLQPGEKTTIKTFITHPWMFTDGPGNCHEIFKPKRGVKTFRITVERQDLEDE
jgi:VHL beta domain